jgi:hypothetical protein
MGLELHHPVVQLAPLRLLQIVAAVVQILVRGGMQVLMVS